MYCRMKNAGRFAALWLLLWVCQANRLVAQEKIETNIRFVDYFFDNASRVTWEIQGDSIMKISLLPDYERTDFDRQTTHCYFRLVADKGAHIRFLLTKAVRGYYNGRKIPRERNWSVEYDNPVFISYDQKTWSPLQTTKVADGADLLVELDMKGESVFIADLPPYTLTDLEQLKERINGNKAVKILRIGETVEKRPIEVIQLGNPTADAAFLIRARAHAWEAGGNWVVEGLVSEFMANAAKWDKSFCVFVLPMANKDGVARGMTRFTVSGIDLNRNWSAPPDAALCPENYALEKFITGLLAKGIKPALAIDLHNDSSGGILLGQVNDEDDAFIERMRSFDGLMRRLTSFSERLKFTTTSARRPESPEKYEFNDGLRRRFGIDAIIYELNAHWIGSLQKVPSVADFKNVGRDMNSVFYEYARLHSRK